MLTTLTRMYFLKSKTSTTTQINNEIESASDILSMRPKVVALFCKNLRTIYEIFKPIYLEVKGFEH